MDRGTILRAIDGHGYIKWDITFETDIYQIKVTKSSEPDFHPEYTTQIFKNGKFRDTFKTFHSNQIVKRAYARIEEIASEPH